MWCGVGRRHWATHASRGSGVVWRVSRWVGLVLRLVCEVLVSVSCPSRVCPGSSPGVFEHHCCLVCLLAFACLLAWSRSESRRCGPARWQPHFHWLFCRSHARPTTDAVVMSRTPGPHAGLLSLRHWHAQPRRAPVRQGPPRRARPATGAAGRQPEMVRLRQEGAAHDPRYAQPHP